MSFTYRRRSSVDGATNRPQHMRWRDKIAYLEKGGSSRNIQQGGTAERGTAPAETRAGARRHSATCDDSPSCDTGKASEVDDHHTGRSCRQSDPGSQTGEGASNDNADRQRNVNAQHHTSYSHGFKHHPPHIRFRDKMAILRGEKPATSGKTLQSGNCEREEADNETKAFNELQDLTVSE